MHLSTSVTLFERFDFLRRRSYSFSMDSMVETAGDIHRLLGLSIWGYVNPTKRMAGFLVG